MNTCCVTYGWVSHVNRGKRKKAEEQAQHAVAAGAVEIPPPLGSSLFKQRWAELIKKVHAADPLLCQRCGGAMRIIAVIDQPDVIEKILRHLGLWPHPRLRQGFGGQAARALPDGAVA